MAVNSLWPDPNAPQQGFTLPASVGPMVFPVQKPKRRWGRVIFASTLCAFAGGVAAGPTLQDHAYQGVDAAAFFIVTNAPPWLARYIPPSPNRLPPPSRSFATPTALPPPALPEPEPVAQAQDESPTPTAEVAERRPPSSAPRIEPLAALPEVPPPADVRPSRSKHGKPAARAQAREVSPAPAGVPTSRRAKQTDPFDTAGGTAEAVTPRREVAAALPRSEPAPTRARSNDGLDELMGASGGESASATRGKRSTSRAIDDMLKDVQKSEPAPAPRKSEPAALPSLTASDITKAMAGVKTRANECGKSLGQKGMAELKLTVGKDGRVSNVIVGGKPAGSPLGDCIARAARAASFPPSAGLKFDYRIDVR